MRTKLAEIARGLEICGLLLGAAACGIGDNIVTGVGNGGARIYGNPVIDEVADALASDENVPEIGDDLLVRSFAAIRNRAEQGDAEAVLILFRVAERQRERRE